MSSHIGRATSRVDGPAKVTGAAKYAAEFDAPDTFDVGRTPNRHLSFGRGGPHLCLGVHLARLEVKVVLAALARRVSRFELAGEPRRIRSNFTNGLKELPIRMLP